VLSTPLGLEASLHINKPFEVCLLPVLLSAAADTKEKVGGKQRIEVLVQEIRNVLTTCGAKTAKNERNYW